MDSGLTLGSQDDAPPTLDRSTEQASLAPDGRSVAHIVVDDGYPRAVQRFVRDGHALHSRWVTLPVAGPVIAVRHSPDSRWLACQVAPDAGVRDEVWLVTNDPEDPRSWPLRVAEEASVELVGWDGSRVVLAGVLPDGTCRARLVDPETGCSTILHEGRLSHVLDSWRGDCLVRIGPRSYRETQLVRADGSTVRLLPADHGSVTDQGVIVDPARAFRPDAGTETPGSPVGTRVFLRSNVHAGTHRLVEVLVDDAGRTTWRSLVERAGATLDEFVISADGEVAALLWNRKGLSELELAHLGRGSIVEVRLEGGTARDLTISGDGSLIGVTIEGPGVPRHVELIGGDATVWGPVEPVRASTDTVFPERHEFTASDGLRLNGWLHRAPGVRGGEPGRPRPLVLYFHGGPEWEERPSANPYLPALVSAGYSVFAVNVRGSTGAGRAYEHADEVHRRPDGIRDVADTVAYLVEAGIADPDRVVCTGRSYGGYLTMAALAFYPDLFRAGVAVCGMSDLRTFYEHTEPWIAEAAHTKYGDPVRDADLLEQLSPLTHVDAVRAPLLTIHGEHDTNVPVSESTQMVQALRERGRVAESLVLPGEGHAIVMHESKTRLCAAMIDWFDTHLADEDTPAEHG